MIKYIFSLFYVSIILVTSQNVYSQSSVLIPRKILFTGEQRTIFKLSPDGTKLYYSNNISSSVFVAKTSKPNEISEIKVMKGTSNWEPVSQGLIAFVNDSSANIILYHHNGEIEKINILENAQSISLITKHRRNYDLIVLSVNFADSLKSGIYSFDVKAKSAKKLYNPIQNINPFFDDEFNLIAANRNNELGGISISLYNKNENSWLDLISHEFTEDMFIGGFSKIISVSGNGNNVWFTSNYYSDKSKLYRYNIPEKRIDTIAESKLVDLLPMGVSIGLDGNVTSVVGLYAETIRIVTDSNYKGDFDFLKSSIHGDISFGGQSQDGNIWLVREFTGGPAKLYHYDRKNKNLTYIMNDFPELNDYKLSRRKAFVVKSRDSINLPIHVYLPNGSDKNNDGIPDTPLPTILYVHGGPWVGVSHWNQYFQWRNFQLLANRGYAVINCDFRGATGYGKEFTTKSYKKWGSTMTDDKVDIAEWAVRNKIAQKEKVGIWGWSYGGYAAFAGAAFHPDTYACAVSMYGISDLVSFGKIPFANNDFWKERVGDSFDSLEAKFLKDFSPINYIEKIKTPMLLTTGSKDERIPKMQMDSMANVLNKAGKEVIYFYYPEEVHDYRNPQSWISFWAVTEQFLSAKLGGRYENVNNDIQNSDMVVVEGQKYIDKMN
jgi:acetyl esterase/lipase